MTKIIIVWPVNFHTGIIAGILIRMAFKTLLIDLDETVYPAACGVWPAISARMEQYMAERLGIDPTEVPELRRALYTEYGTTLRGLQIRYHVDEMEYIEYVHDVPLDSLLVPNPELRDVLRQLPQRKLIFTNADRKHAGRVLRVLGIEDCFEGIIDILDISPYCKPMLEAYQIALRLVGEPDPAACVFVDDSPRNLAGARAAGLYTVQVGVPEGEVALDGVQVDAHIFRLADLPSILKDGSR